MRLTRDQWGEGPWMMEPDRWDWTDAVTGLACEALRVLPMGHWCGYVYLPADHMWLSGMSSDQADEELRVVPLEPPHGGLTFAGEGKIGFDCAHYQDYVPGISLVSQRSGPPYPIYRTLEFVRVECARLAMAVSLYPLFAEIYDDEVTLDLN